MDNNMLSAIALDTNIFGLTVFDPLTEKIADSLQGNLQQSDLEIEGRLCIFYNANRQRMQYNEFLPGLMGQSQDQHRSAETELGEMHFKLLKGYLNARVHQYNVNRQGPAITYTRSHTIDYLYKDKFTNTRVSKDFKTKEIINVITKNKMQHIDILNNHGLYDYRVAQATETKAELPSENSIPTWTREKQRRSYFCGIWRIDLTEIVQPHGRNDYEVEVEIAEEYMKQVVLAANDANEGKKTQIFRIIKALINCLQTLTQAMTETFKSPLLQSIPFPAVKRPLE